MPENDSSVSVDEARQSAVGMYLTFRLGAENYGIEILRVQEIIGMMSVTRVPRTPDFIRGVINLRGKVIPVMNLRAKFSMPNVEDTSRTCIIVVTVGRNSDTVTMGLIVDEVCDVVDICAAQIEPSPEFGASVDTAFMLGMGKLEDRLVMLLNVERVLSAAEWTHLANAAA